MKQVNEYCAVMAIAITALVLSVISYHIFGI